MQPTRNTMTPVRISILGLRFIAVLLFVDMVPSVGYLVGLLATPTNNTDWGWVLASPSVASLMVHGIMLLILLRYSEPIARALSRSLPKFVVGTRWTRRDMVAAIFAGVAMFEMLSGIPALVSQTYGIISRYRELTIANAPERVRFNALLFGLIGAMLRVGIAGLIFLKSSRLAVAWERWQSAGGLKRRRQMGNT
jgi:hypothetical protein